MIKLNGHVVTPTIFPDGTSQVWNIPAGKQINPDSIIEWEFENEAEIIHVLQLADLVMVCSEQSPKLYMPYLPYARQDKKITNYSTFALRTFLSVLLTGPERFKEIIIIDAHSTHLFPNPARTAIVNVLPNDRIKEVIGKVKPDLTCFPDAGASTRGYNTQGIASFNLEKKRNQTTGEIEGLTTTLPLDLAGLKILILDDICDGGRTFIEAAKLLYKMGVSEVNLYTSHGLYTKGVGCLKEAGIKRIFNYKGEV